MPRRPGRGEGAPGAVADDIADAASRRPLADIVESHERLLHLIVVRRDLAGFQHLHLEPTGRPGAFAVELAFPTAGNYRLFAEFARADGRHVLAADDLVVEGADGPAPFGPGILFRHTFPAPGLYKTWAQVQRRGGDVVTAEFTVRVR